jgi:HAMP domain-containing protein
MLPLRPSLRTKFLAGTLAIILVMSIATIVLVRAYLTRQLTGLIERNGKVLASHIASHSISPLLTEQYFDLEMMSRDLLQDAGRDIRYIFYTDRHGTVVSHTFAQGFPSTLKSANLLPPGKADATKHLVLGEEPVIDIAVPILQGDIGALHIGFSQEQVARDVRSVVAMITWIVLCVLVLGVGLAFLVETRVIKPIRVLTDAVVLAGKGELSHRVPVESDDELGQLARSFNETLELRQKAEADRDANIARLQESLAKVNQLSGLLPICASCKKIRDDKGYWSQIEAYISDHSEAEFSHGLCPDCLQKLYHKYLPEK